MTAGIAYDPFAPEVMADPHLWYRALRDESPVHYLPAYDTWVLSRFDDIWHALADTSGALVGVEGTVPPAEVLRRHHETAAPAPGTDPLIVFGRYPSPTYEQVRQAHIGPLKPRRVAALAERVRELTRRHLDDCLDRGSFDLVQDFAGLVSAGMVCDLLGLPEAEAGFVLQTVNRLTTTDPEGAGLDPARMHAHCVDILQDLVVHFRAAAPTDVPPMVQGLLTLAIDGRALTDREVATQMVFVFVGGTETVPKVTAHGLWELAKHPDQLAAVRDDLPGNARVAVGEFARYCAPAQWFLRSVAAPTEVAGQPVTPGQRVMFLLGSAARDEREFDAPDTFRWDRPIARELSFGRGQRFCMGIHLAKLEIATMIEEFLSEVEEFRVDEEHALRPPSSFQWGWTSVPVHTTRRG